MTHMYCCVLRVYCVSPCTCISTGEADAVDPWVHRQEVPDLCALAGGHAEEALGQASSMKACGHVQARDGTLN